MIWLIQVKDGKLLDEMAVSMTGLANKVGWADICHAVQMQNQSPERGVAALMQHIFSYLGLLEQICKGCRNISSSNVLML